MISLELDHDDTEKQTFGTEKQTFGKHETIVEILTRLRRLEKLIKAGEPKQKEIIGPPSYNFSPQLATRYKRTSKTIRQWRRNPLVNFPKPDLVVAGRPAWSEAVLVAWERESAARKIDPAA